MKVERIFEGNHDFTEILLTLIDSLIDEMTEKLYNDCRVNTVMAHTSKEKECVGL